MHRTCLAALTLLFAGCAHTHEAGAGSEVGGWLDPWRHRHANSRGTPYVHAIGMEPAFLDRELLLTYHHVDAPDETEDEIEAEVEWALTDRLGVAIAVPFARVSESGASAHAGIGDVAVAPRAVLVDTDRFLLSASMDFAFATGDDSRDLGSGEFALGPALSTWSDLGGCVSLQARVGTAHGMESGDDLLDYYASLIWTLTGPISPTEHRQVSMANLIAELGGRTVLDGSDEHRTTTEALVGAAYAFDARWEVRGGFQFPVGGQQDIDHGFVLGASWHF